jgi:hypothetical protein
MHIYIPMIFGDFQKQGVFQQNQFGSFSGCQSRENWDHCQMDLK